MGYIILHINNLKQNNMKLYTEEEVKRAINLALDSPTHANLVIDHLSPIELPSDDEIEKQANKYVYDDHVLFITSALNQKRYGFADGAKWIKDKILNK